MDDEIDEETEEEVTRCICGSQEYPGLPTASPDSSKKNDPNSSNISEDSTGWFIQCDNCKVWQHGGCVGIMDESTSPDEYFCEQCRSDLHKVMTTTNGYVRSTKIPAITQFLAGENILSSCQPRIRNLNQHHQNH